MFALNYLTTVGKVLATESKKATEFSKKILTTSSPSFDPKSTKKKQRTVRHWKAYFVGVGKNFDYLCNRVVYLVFSPDLLMKISNFSKIVHTIFIKFYTVILPPNGLLRAQRHQNCKTAM